MAKVPVKFYKVLNLPGDGQIEPNSLYFVEKGDNAESYLSNSQGVMKRIGNSEMIDALISQVVAGAVLTAGDDRYAQKLSGFNIGGTFTPTTEFNPNTADTEDLLNFLCTIFVALGATNNT